MQGPRPPTLRGLGPTARGRCEGEVALGPRSSTSLISRSSKGVRRGRTRSRRRCLRPDRALPDRATPAVATRVAEQHSLVSEGSRSTHRNTRRNNTRRSNTRRISTRLSNTRRNNTRRNNTRSRRTWRMWRKGSCLRCPPAHPALATTLPWEETRAHGLGWRGKRAGGLERRLCRVCTSTCPRRRVRWQGGARGVGTRGAPRGVQILWVVFTRATLLRTLEQALTTEE